MNQVVEDTSFGLDSRCALCPSRANSVFLDVTPVVSSLWRTSEIHAGIILGRILQRDLLDEWECCWRGEDVLGVEAPLLFCAML